MLENKALAGKNSERFLQLIVNLDLKINSLIELVDKQSFKEKIIILYEQAKEYLENSLKDYLYTLHDRYNDCMQFRSNLDKIKVIGLELHDQYEKWTQNHEKIIDYIKSNDFTELKTRLENGSVRYTRDDGAYQITSEFLQSIGQVHQFQSCEVYEKDLLYQYQQNIYIYIYIYLIANLLTEYLTNDESFRNCVNTIDNLSNVFFNLKQLLYQYQQNIFSNLLRYSILNDYDLKYCYNELHALKIEEFFYLVDRNNFEENFSLVRLFSVFQL